MIPTKNTLLLLSLLLFQKQALSGGDEENGGVVEQCHSQLHDMISEWGNFRDAPAISTKKHDRIYLLI